MTGRGRSALLSAAGLYLTAWAFGARELYPVAVGLAVAVAVALAWSRFVRGPFALVRSVEGEARVEGESVVVDVELEAERGPLPVRAELLDLLAGIGEVTVALERRGAGSAARLRGSYTVRGLTRGRYRLRDAVVRVGDPLGLAVVEAPVEGSGMLVVHPRVTVVERLFDDTSGHGAGRSRRASRAPSAGIDIHGVREHAPGEPLRAVHWPSSARRGRLMVKELEEAPRDEASVVLDAQAGSDAGAAPDSSFEQQVRAAASVLRSLAAAGRRPALVVNGRHVERCTVDGLDRDWQAALDLLAGAAPDGRRPLASLLEQGRSGADARRLVLVTAGLTPQLADRALALGGARELAIVWVDAPTWTGADADAAGDERARMLRRRGIAVAILRRGDGLQRVLSAAEPAPPAELVPA